MRSISGRAVAARSSRVAASASAPPPIVAVGGGGVLRAQSFFHLARGLQRRKPLGGRERFPIRARAAQRSNGERAIEIVAAQSRVAAGRDDLEYAARQTQNRNIKSPAAQIVNDKKPLRARVQTVSDGGGGRLVQQPQNLDSRQARGVFGRLPLPFVEIRRGGDDRARDGLAALRLRAVFQNAQNLRRNLDRGFRALRGAQFNQRFRIRRAAFDLRRQRMILRARVGGGTPHQALDRKQRRARRFGAMRERVESHGDFLRSVKNRRRQKRAPGIVLQNARAAVFGDGDERVRRPQIDADRKPPRARRPPGIGDLQ